MAKKRRGPRCRGVCCPKPECSISVQLVWKASENRWVFRVGVWFKNVASGSATLTDYSGAAFTYPEFNGTVELPSAGGACAYARIVLSVTSASGENKQCVWLNPNCCCEFVGTPACNEYRVPFSRGTNQLQPSLLVTLAGITTMSYYTTCSVHGFFNGAYLVPFGGEFLKVDTITCTINGFNYQVRRSLQITWGKGLCPTTTPCNPDPLTYCSTYPSTPKIGFRHVCSIIGSSQVLGLSNAYSGFNLGSAACVPAAEDYVYRNCSTYRSECLALLDQVSCNSLFPQATVAPPGVSCSAVPGSTPGCCGSPSPCPTCANQCGGPGDFRGATASFTLVP